jgi:hypothetical protein
VPEPFDQHARGLDHGIGVGDALSGDVGGGAVRGLRHGDGAFADAKAGRHAQPPDEAGGFVGQDVAEHVGGDDDVEALRIADQARRHRIDDDLVDGDVRKLRGDPVALLDEHAAAELEHGVLVNQRQQLAALPGELEGGPRDARRAEAGNDAHRDRHVLGRPELARPGHDVAVGLEALVILAHDDQVNIVVDGAEVGEGPRRPDIREEVEALAQDRMRVDGAGHLRIGLMPDRPEDEPVHGPEGLDRALRKGRAMRVEGRAADRHRPPVDAERSLRGGRLHHRDSGRNDLKADVVTVEDAERQMGRHVPTHFLQEARTMAPTSPAPGRFHASSISSPHGFSPRMGAD